MKRPGYFSAHGLFWLIWWACLAGALFGFWIFHV